MKVPPLEMFFRVVGEERVHALVVDAQPDRPARRGAAVGGKRPSPSSMTHRERGRKPVARALAPSGHVGVRGAPGGRVRSLRLLPLADHLGYELAEAIALCAGLFGAAPGVAAARAERREPTRMRRAPRPRPVLAGTVALALPVVLILLNGLRRPACDPLPA